ncbi:flagellar biosynthesis protein FlhB [Asticcacaulis sp. EMRT-3]|uniref:flagellar biosynthesis protein FlhB n=1 Tax=Asticcacaulis sp. EMRT-3 TaxID=3040349 RepID=UPI0024AF9630|nr:flagellar biosynthesis protein FlhB [Asticcacaulis sp. EMRT-3]MDI7773813.1 flagellar biosynthesis protein FlhB [Asticcacaulis sp. EMRT-3]
MAEGSEGEDKTEQASGRKLEQARASGDVAKSSDVPSALSLIGVCGLLAFQGPAICRHLLNDLLPFVAHPEEFLDSLQGDGGLTIAHEVVMAILPILLMILGTATFFGVAGNVLQTGLIFAPDKLKPKFDKLNILESFKRMFGVDSLVQFLKTVLKLIATGIVVWMVLKNRTGDLLALTGASPALIMPYAAEALKALAMAVCIFLFVSAAADYMWQRFRFMERMKMSKQEVKDEYKQTEGDPHVKAKLRSLRIQKSRQRMMANVAKATVVVTNPTHYAVALHYEMGHTMAPVCVAKGMDDVALRIRAEAGKHDVPVIEDPPLARALYASMEIDDVIPEAHFAAVAKLISFVLTRKRRGF